ncbi:MAG: ribonuclease HI [Enterobacterales bacterium]|jgi:ribonuclease HI
MGSYSIAHRELMPDVIHEQGTNNSAELKALRCALHMATKEVHEGRTVAIFSDSQYSIKSITIWGDKRSAKDWVSALKNRELIIEMYNLYQELRDEVPIYYVSGHAGIEGNELADRMAMQGIKEQERTMIAYLGMLDIESLLLMDKG